MKIVYNEDLYNNSLSQKYFEIKKYSEKCYIPENIRENSDLIEIVESENYRGGLRIAELPDEITDYLVFRLEDREVLFYVLDGQIYCYNEN